MARRRTAEEIQRARASAWVLLKDHGYAGFTFCPTCGRERYCRGKSLDARVCEECFMTKRKDLMSRSELFLPVTRNIRSNTHARPFEHTLWDVLDSASRRAILKFKDRLPS